MSGILFGTGRSVVSALHTKTLGFRVLGEQPARMLGAVLQTGFGQFLIDLSVPAKSMTLPPPSQPDYGRLIETARRYDVEILGPLAVSVSKS